MPALRTCGVGVHHLGNPSSGLLLAQLPERIPMFAHVVAFRRSRIAALTTVSLLSSTALLVSHAGAQALTFVATGTRYASGGEMMGQQMTPWEANWVVRDTVAEGRKLVAITHNTIHTDVPATFTATAFIDPASGRMLQYFGMDGGQAPGMFALRLAAGRLSGTIQQEGAGVETVDAELAESSVSADVLPFALAARALKDADTIPLHVFTFQSSSGRVFQYNFVGIVRSGSFQREGGSTVEPVWIVSGSGGYAATFTIAKADRRVLQMVFQQGTVGTETDTYAGPLKQ
jgi:hypothetical protein